MKTFTLEVGEGRCAIRLDVSLPGEGVIVVFSGGDKPHLGGTVLSVPRKSLSGQGISCDSWVCPVPGHKDTLVAQDMAELLCRSTGEVVSVVGGVHIPNATMEEINLVRKYCLDSADLILDRLTVIKEQKNEVEYV